MNQIKWFGIYIGAGFFLSILLPFPMSFVRCLGIFFIIGNVRARLRLKNLSISMKSLFRQPSSKFGSRRTIVRYYCMICGIEHKEISYPKCGSKMKRVG
ncbi:MAG: hypothetical protein ACRD8W_27810 [Nitrososphaeraceae archaeon]